MPTINVKTPFFWSPDGKKVITVPAGEQEVSDRCATVAVDQLKVATRVAGGKAPAKPKVGAGNTKAKTD